MPTLAFPVRRLIRRMLEAAGWLGLFYRAPERQIAARAGAWPAVAADGLPSPTPLADEAFDILFAISVLSHMPRGRMAAWLTAFHRVLEAGGLALVSFAYEARAELADRDRPGAALTPTLLLEGFATSTRTLEGSNFMSSYATVAAFTAMAGQVFELPEVASGRRTDQSLAWSVLRRR